MFCYATIPGRVEDATDAENMLYGILEKHNVHFDNPGLAIVSERRKTHFSNVT
jgi:hypothetical protein